MCYGHVTRDYAALKETTNDMHNMDESQKHTE